VEKEADGIVGIVRNGKGVDTDVADLEGSAGVEEMGVEGDLELGFDGFLGEAIAIDGELQFAGETDEAGDVIGMLVGDEDAVQSFGSATEGLKALPDLASAQAGVNQKARLGSFEIRAIASGAAAKIRQGSRHLR
jgi:hypothetical protein